MQASNRELRAQRSDLLKQARQLTAKGRLNPAEQKRFDDLMAQADQVREQYEEFEARMTGNGIRGGPILTETREETTRDRDHAVAFRSYLRFGRNEMPREHREFLEANFRARIETRDMGLDGGNSLTGPGGSFLVPIGFSDRIEAALKFSGNLMKYAEVLPTATGAPMPWPLSDDTQNQATIVGEGQQVQELDVTLSNVIFGAYKFSSGVVKASLELVTDSAFDIENWLTGVMGIRFARGLNAYFTNGLGVSQSQPMGLITAAAAAGNLVTAVGNSANTGGVGGGNTIGSSDLFSLVHACDPAYREDPSCRFLMHDQTRKALAQTLDKFGQPLFPMSLVNGAPDRICGYEVGLDNAMSQLQVTASSPPVTRYTVAFGPMRKYVIRKVRDMSLLVLRERWADYGQLGYLMFLRCDGNLLNAAQEAAQSPISLLANVF
jgi:HK97 family phage major capsid protein